MTPGCTFCHRPLLEARPDEPCPACLLGVALSDPQGPGSIDFSEGSRNRELNPIGRYQLLETIGAGASGVVYRAWDPHLCREVALKTLHGHLTGDVRRIQQERFRHEAAVVARLDHPHIAPLYDHGEHDGSPWLVQKLYSAGDLGKVLTSAVAPAKAAGWICDLADAVAEAHRQGVLHRDIKPSNIFLDECGRVFLGDFGIARTMFDAARGATLTGQAVGSPSYMAPEQARGGGSEVGPAADIHGLGALLYHALTGYPPFTGATFESIIRQVIEQDPLPPRRLNPSVPADLENICLKCLEKEPHRRYRNAVGLRDDLVRFLAGEPVLARPLTQAGRIWRSCRRRPVVAALGVALFMSLLAGLAVTTTAMVRLDAANQRRQESRDKLAFELFDRWSLARETRQGLDAMGTILRESPGHPAATRRAWSALTERQIPMPLLELSISNGLAGAFDQSGSRVVIQTSDGRLAVCDANDGRVLGEHTIPDRAAPRAIGFSPSGDHVWRLGEDGSMKGWSLFSWKSSEETIPETWNPASPPLLSQVDAADSFSHVFSPDGRQLVLIYKDFTFDLRDTASGKVLVPRGMGWVFGNSNPFPSRAARPRLLVHNISNLEFRDPVTGTFIGDPLDLGVLIQFACWDPRGQRVLVIPQGARPVIAEAPGSPPKHPTAALGKPLREMRYSEDGRFIALTTRTDGVHLLESGTLMEPEASRSMFDQCAGAAWVGSRLLAVGRNGDAFFYDPASSSSTPAFSAGPSCLRLAVSPNSRHAATLSSDGCIDVWDLVRQPLVRVGSGSFEPPSTPISETGTPSVFGFGFSRKGDRIAVTFNTGQAEVWRFPGMNHTSLRGSRYPSYGWDFHPAADQFVMADQQGTVWSWDLNSGTPASAEGVANLPFVTRAAFDSTGRHLLLAAVYGRAVLRPWPMTPTAAPVVVVDKDAWQVVAAPSEDLFAIAQSTGVVEIRTLPHALVQARWKLPSVGQFNDMTFSPDGCRLALGSNGGEVFELRFPSANVPPPAWFVEWVEAMGQRGTLMDPSGPNSGLRRILRLRQRLAALEGDGFWDAWGRGQGMPQEP